NGICGSPGTIASFLGFLRAFANAQSGDEGFRQNALLSRHKSAGDPSPQNPPLRAAKLVGAMMKFFCEELPGLRDAPVIHSKSKAGAKREAKKVQPPRFVRHAASPAFFDLHQFFPNSAQQRRRPIEPRRR